MTAEEYLRTHWMKHEVWKGLAAPMHQERLRLCAVAVRGGRTFIDVGCGLGHSTAILKRFCPGDWTGMDAYEEAIVRARELFPDIRFQTKAAADEVFDGVVCSEVIEHVEDPRDFVKTLWRITSRKLVVTTPRVPVNDPGHLRLFTEESLREAFKDVPAVKISRNARFFYITAERET